MSWREEIKCVLSLEALAVLGKREGKGQVDGREG